MILFDNIVKLDKSEGNCLNIEFFVFDVNLFYFCNFIHKKIRSRAET